MIVKAKTYGHELILLSDPLLTSESKEVDILEVTLDDTWSELMSGSSSLNAAFWKSKREEAIKAQMTESNGMYRVDIPYLAFERAGYIHFGIYAEVDNSVIMTSNVIRYPVVEGTPVDGAEPPTEQQRTELAEALSEYLGTGTSSIYYENATFPDFGEMTFPELVAYLNELRQLINLSADRLSFAENVSVGTVGAAVSVIWDFAFKKLADIKTELINEYIAVNQMTPEEAASDPFIQSWQQSIITDWHDVGYWGYDAMHQISQKCEEVTENYNALLDGMEEILEDIAETEEE